MKHIKRADWVIIVCTIIISACPQYALYHAAAFTSDWSNPSFLWLILSPCLVALFIVLLILRAYARGESDAMAFDRIVFSAKDREIARLQGLLDGRK